MTITRASRKKRWKRSHQPRYWVIATFAAGAVIAYTFGNSRHLTVAYARSADTRAASVRVDDAGEKFDFRIAAGPLSEVISKFEKQTGLKVSADAGLLTVDSPGVVGRFTAEQALSLLLENTGISFARIDAVNFKIEVRAASAAVDVKVSNAEEIASPKYPDSLRNTPQTVNVISNAVIREQNATTLREVLTNVPGITFTAGEGGTPAGDNLNIRGFSARNDVYVDGARDLGPQSRDSFNIEQVEVVKGPSSAFTGRGSTGGTINLVSKLPNLRRSFSGTVSGGTSGLKRVVADIDVPITESIATRINVMGHDSDFPGRETAGSTRWGFAPSIGFGLIGPTRFYASYFYLGEKNTSDYGIPWVPAANNALAAFRDQPAPVPRNTFYGYVDRDKEKLRSDLVTLRFERDFNDRLSLRSQLRYGYSRRDSIATPGRFKNNNSTAISREFKSWITNDRNWDSQTDLSARIRTGSMQHSIVFGGALSYEGNMRVLRSAPDALTTLFGPDPNDVYTGAITIDPRRPFAHATTLAGYIFDSVTINKYFGVSGGIRLDRFAVKGMNTATVAGLPTMAAIDRTDNLLSGRAALLFHPTESGTIYASFGSSADPSLEGLLYSPADVRTPPESTRTLELGTKWELFDARLLLTGALFEVRKNNARTASLIAGEPPTLDGDQRIRGLEFGATGNITRNWQVLAAYTFLDSKILRSNTAPTNVNGILISEVGKEMINTPRNSFSIWSTYRWRKLFFGGGPRFVGKRYGNNINTRAVDGYWIADAMGSYDLTRHITLQVNLSNIGDKFYFDRMTGGHVVPGAGRSISTGIRFSY